MLFIRNKLRQRLLDIYPGLPKDSFGHIDRILQSLTLIHDLNKSKSIDCEVLNIIVQIENIFYSLKNNSKKADK